MQRQNKTSSVFIVFVTLLLTIGSVASPIPVYAASTITVTTNADNTTTDTLCSLREAIENANGDTAAFPDCAAGSGNDTIVFDPVVFPDFASSPTIVLGSHLTGLTDVDGLTIDGGAAYVKISGNRQYAIFAVVADTSLTLKNLRVYDGLSSSGAGAWSNGTLTIDHCAFVGNRAVKGGAVFSTSVGPTIIKNSIFLRNSSSGSSSKYGGGAIYHDVNGRHSLEVSDSGFHGNRASYGAAIYINNVNSGSVLITRSSFMDNDGVSGAILNKGTTTISNSTFTGNDATDIGGAIYNLKSLLIWNSTFSGNSAISHGGGDIYQLGAATNLDLYNNIFANNLGGGHCGNSSGAVSGNNNLIEDASSACGLKNGVNGNIIGSDPALGPLSGLIVFNLPPPYFPLNSGSRAIDAVSDANCPAVDPRGVTRPQGSRCDIGSYEYEIP